MSTKDNVRRLLSDNERLRDNDVYLYFAYVQEHHGFQLSDRQKMMLSQLPTFETVTRRRRELRDEFPGSEAAEKVRYQKYQEYVDEYGRPAMRLAE